MLTLVSLHESLHIHVKKLKYSMVQYFNLLPLSLTDTGARAQKVVDSVNNIIQ